jgi:hypothetical protein
MISTKSGVIRVCAQSSDRLIVIPAKAGTRGEHMDVLGFEKRGIHRQCEAWIPALAGMTTRFFCSDLPACCIWSFNAKQSSEKRGDSAYPDSRALRRR